MREAPRKNAIRSRATPRTTFLSDISAGRRSSAFEEDAPLRAGRSHMDQKKQIESTRKAAEKIRGTKKFQDAVDALQGIWGRPPSRGLNRGILKRAAPPPRAPKRPAWIAPNRSVKDLWKAHRGRQPQDELLPERGIVRRRNPRPQLSA